jgi:protein-tyrosine phosphatase
MDAELIEYCRSIGMSLQYIKDLLFGKLRNTFQIYWSTNWNGSQITENIYISDLASAYNREKLLELGITHVVTTVLGIKPMFPDSFEYFNIEAQDIPSQDLQQYFRDSTDFMEKAINNGGRVLVHCSYGISRSASVVIAYLIKNTGKSYQEILEFVKSKRNIVQPNPGFENQLLMWEASLRGTTPVPILNSQNADEGEEADGDEAEGDEADGDEAERSSEY